MLMLLMPLMIEKFNPRPVLILFLSKWLWIFVHAFVVSKCFKFNLFPSLLQKRNKINFLNTNFILVVLSRVSCLLNKNLFCHFSNSGKWKQFESFELWKKMTRIKMSGCRGVIFALSFFSLVCCGATCWPKSPKSPTATRGKRIYNLLQETLYSRGHGLHTEFNN